MATTDEMYRIVKGAAVLATYGAIEVFPVQYKYKPVLSTYIF